MAKIRTEVKMGEVRREEENGVVEIIAKEEVGEGRREMGDGAVEAPAES